MCFNVAKAGLFTEDTDIISDCLWAISYMVDTEDDTLIAFIAQSEALPQIINYLSHKDMTIFIPALRCVGNILTTNDNSVIERCVFNNVIDKLTNILF
jgi:hypothetical protein